MGDTVCGLVSPDREVVTVAEGDEDDDFWSSLGGQGEYQTARDLNTPLLSPRLFHCSVSPAGCLRVHEVSLFAQEVSKSLSISLSSVPSPSHHLLLPLPPSFSCFLLPSPPFSPPFFSLFVPLRPSSSLFVPLRPSSSPFVPLRPSSSLFLPLPPSSSLFLPLPRPSPFLPPTLLMSDYFF